jgi:hypothetical protein
MFLVHKVFVFVTLKQKVNDIYQSDWNMVKCSYVLLQFILKYTQRDVYRSLLLRSI